MKLRDLYITVPNNEQLVAAVRLAMSMWDESPVYRGMERLSDTVIEFAVAARGDDDYFVRVAIDGLGTVCGFFVGYVADLGYHKSRGAWDRMLYVAPDARGGLVAKTLIHAFEEWAIARGASRIMLGTTTGVHTERTEKLYNALGYATVGVLTMKEVG